MVHRYCTGEMRHERSDMGVRYCRVEASWKHSSQRCVCVARGAASEPEFVEFVSFKSTKG